MYSYLRETFISSENKLMTANQGARRHAREHNKRITMTNLYLADLMHD